MFKNLSPRALALSGSQSELIELALSFGFRGLDLDLLEFADQVRTHGLPHARRLLDSAKLQIGGFLLPTRWQEDDATFREDLKQLTELLPTVSEAGLLRRALTWLDPATDERPFHQNFEACRQRLVELAKVLGSHNIRLGVGFNAAPEARSGKSFEFIHTVEALLMLVSVVPAKNVGVIADLWDLHVCGGSIDSLAKLGAERIVAVRLSDAPSDVTPGELKATQRLLPGEGGAIDASAALVKLAEMGYDGPITPAAHPDQLKGLRREAAVKRVGETLDRVWKGAGLTAGGKLAPPVRR